MSELTAVVEALREGGVVALPTDTLYGLVCRADRPDAIERIFEIKQRPCEKSLQILVPGVEWLGRWAVVTPAVIGVAEAFWPGPLTIVAMAESVVPDHLPRDDGTIGLRMPAHDVALDVLAQVGPLAASSANLAGDPPFATIEELTTHLPGLDAWLDGGRIEGTGSTVVDVTGAEVRVLREGPISAADVTTALTGGQFDPG